MFGLRKRIKTLEKIVEGLNKRQKEICLEIVRTPTLFNFTASETGIKARIQALLDHFGLELQYNPGKTIKDKFIAINKKEEILDADIKGPGND